MMVRHATHMVPLPEPRPGQTVFFTGTDLPAARHSLNFFFRWKGDQSITQGPHTSPSFQQVRAASRYPSRTSLVRGSRDATFTPASCTILNCGVNYLGRK
jgi:hypothetical protein